MSKTKVSTKIMTAGQLVEALRDLDPNTPVYVSGFHVRGVSRITLTTTGNPATGRHGGDPEGTPCAVIE